MSSSNRKSKAVEISGYKFVIHEPLRSEVLQAEGRSRDATPNGQAWQLNMGVYNTKIIPFMLESWTNPDGSVVEAKDYDKSVMDLPNSVASQLVLACRDLNDEISAEEKAFLLTLLDAVPRSNSSTPSK